MAPKEKKGKLEQFASDLLIGGISGAVAKTLMSPIERVKILMQTQDSNPKILSGEEKRYSGLGDCFRRVQAEQGFRAFWRGNLVNCLRYAPQQGSALAFNDTIRALTPKYDPVKEVVAATAVSLLSGGLSGAAANTICYPFDFAPPGLPQTSAPARRCSMVSLTALSKQLDRRASQAFIAAGL